MRTFFFALVCCVLLAGMSPAETVNIAGEIALSVPDRWRSQVDTTDFPAVLLNESGSAEMLVFKSVLEADETVTDQPTFRTAVTKVVDNVILSLPEARLITNTGFFDGYRLRFVIEFLSLDTVEQVTMRHRLQGLIYRLPDNRQMLYTLWARTTAAEYDGLAMDFENMQGSAVAIGQYERSVFPSKLKFWPIAAIGGILVLGGWIWLDRRRSRQPRTLERVRIYQHRS